MRTCDEDGFLHSLNDEPAVISKSRGYREWYQHGYRHRQIRGDHPASIWEDSGSQVWFFEEDRHRICGPASIIYVTLSYDLRIRWNLHDILYFKEDC